MSNEGEFRNDGVRDVVAYIGRERRTERMSATLRGTASTSRKAESAIHTPSRLH